MITLIQFLCWLFVEFMIVFFHIVQLMQLLGPNAFMRNTPQELADKVMLIVMSCAASSVIIGLCFLRLSTL